MQGHTPTPPLQWRRPRGILLCTCWSVGWYVVSSIGPLVSHTLCNTDNSSMLYSRNFNSYPLLVHRRIYMGLYPISSRKISFVAIFGLQPPPPFLNRLVERNSHDSPPQPFQTCLYPLMRLQYNLSCLLILMLFTITMCAKFKSCHIKTLTRSKNFIHSQLLPEETDKYISVLSTSHSGLL